MLFNALEIMDVIIMTAAVGFIFSDFFARFRRPHHYDPLEEYSKPRFGFENFKFAAMVTAPAIFFHELAHKLVAIGYGMQATFHASYMGLGLGIFLRLVHSPFIIFVPAFVSISGTGTNAQYALISVAGPIMNLILWLGTAFVVKQSLVKKKYYPLLILTSKINMFLFIFNMLPIPGFDGFKFYSALFKVFF